MNNASKKKLVNSFSQVLVAIHNLSADISNEGKKAFTSGDTNSIRELANIVDRVKELETKADKISSVFKTYTLDLVTETHPSEFPLPMPDDTFGESDNKISDDINISRNTVDKNNEPNSIYYIETDEYAVTFRKGINDKFILLSGSYFKWPSLVSKRIIDRLNRYRSNNIVKTQINDNKQIDITVEHDIEFKTIKSMLSFIVGKKVVNTDKYLKGKNGKLLDI